MHVGVFAASGVPDAARGFIEFVVFVDCERAETDLHRVVQSAEVDGGSCVGLQRPKRTPVRENRYSVLLSIELRRGPRRA
jgi:hypothetical protein